MQASLSSSSVLQRMLLLRGVGTTSSAAFAGGSILRRDERCMITDRWLLGEPVSSAGRTAPTHTGSDSDDHTLRTPPRRPEHPRLQLLAEHFATAAKRPLAPELWSLLLSAIQEAVTDAQHDHASSAVTGPVRGAFQLEHLLRYTMRCVRSAGLGPHSMHLDHDQRGSRNDDVRGTNDDDGVMLPCPSTVVVDRAACMLLLDAMLVLCRQYCSRLLLHGVCTGGGPSPPQSHQHLLTALAPPAAPPVADNELLCDVGVWSMGILRHLLHTGRSGVPLDTTATGRRGCAPTGLMDDGDVRAVCRCAADVIRMQPTTADAASAFDAWMDWAADAAMVRVHTTAPTLPLDASLSYRSQGTTTKGITATKKNERTIDAREMPIVALLERCAIRGAAATDAPSAVALSVDDALVARAMGRWTSSITNPTTPNAVGQPGTSCSPGAGEGIGMPRLAVLLRLSPTQWEALCQDVAAHVAAAQQLQHLSRQQQGAHTRTDLIVSLTRIGQVLPPQLPLGMMDVAGLLAALGVETSSARCPPPRASMIANAKLPPRATGAAAVDPLLCGQGFSLFSPAAVWKASKHLPAHQRRAVVAHVLMYLLQRGVLCHDGLSLEDLCVAVGNVRLALCDASFRGMPTTADGQGTAVLSWVNSDMIAAIMDSCRTVFMGSRFDTSAAISPRAALPRPCGPGSSSSSPALKALIAQHLVSIWDALRAAEQFGGRQPLQSYRSLWQAYGPLVDAASHFAKQWLPNSAASRRSGIDGTTLSDLLHSDASLGSMSGVLDGLTIDDVVDLLPQVELHFLSQTYGAAEALQRKRMAESGLVRHPSHTQQPAASALLEAMVLRLDPNGSNAIGAASSASLASARLLLRVLYLCADHAPHLLNTYHSVFDAARRVLVAKEDGLSGASACTAATRDTEPHGHDRTQQRQAPTSVDVLLQRRWDAALGLMAQAGPRTQRRTALFVLRTMLDDAEGMHALTHLGGGEAPDGAQGSSSLNALVRLAAEACRSRNGQAGPAAVLHQLLERVAAASLRSGAWRLGIECHAVAIRVHPRLGQHANDTLHAYLRVLSRMQGRKVLLTHLCAAVCHAVKRSQWGAAVDALVAMQEEDQLGSGGVDLQVQRREQQPRAHGTVAAVGSVVSTSPVQHPRDSNGRLDTSAEAGWWWQGYIAAPSGDAASRCDRDDDMSHVLRALRYSAMVSRVAAEAASLKGNQSTLVEADKTSSWVLAMTMLAHTVTVLPLSLAEAAIVTMDPRETLSIDRPVNQRRASEELLSKPTPSKTTHIPQASPLEHAMLFNDTYTPLPTGTASVGLSTRGGSTGTPTLGVHGRHTLVPLYPQERDAVSALVACKQHGHWTIAIGLLQGSTGGADRRGIDARGSVVPWRFTHLALGACNVAGQWTVAIRAYDTLRRRMRVSMPSTATREALLACQRGKQWVLAMSIFTQVRNWGGTGLLPVQTTVSAPRGRTIGGSAVTSKGAIVQRYANLNDVSQVVRSGGGPDERDRERVLLQATARNACIVMETLLGCGALSVACVVARHVAHLRDPHLVDAVLEAFAASALWNDAVDYFFHAVGRYGVRVRDKSIALAMAACHEVRATQQLHDQHLARSVASMACALEDLCCVSGAILEHVLFVYHRQGGVTTLHLGGGTASHGPHTPTAVPPHRTHHQMFDDL